MLSDSSGRPCIANAVKCIQYYNDIVIGYTGAARVLHPNGHWVDTAMFFTQVLACVGSRSTTKVLEALAVNAKESLDRVHRANPGRPRLPLAFLCVGWERDEPDTSLVRESFTAVVSNFISADGMSVDPSNAGPDFKTLIQRTPPRPPNIGPNSIYLELCHCGCPQTSDEQRNLLEAVRVLVSANEPLMKTINLMKQSIRDTSRRLGNKYVGKDILSAILPQKAPLLDCVAAMSWQGTAGILFGNFPEDSETSYDRAALPVFCRFHPGRDTADYHAPHVVTNGFPIVMLWSPSGMEFHLKGRFIKAGGNVIALAGAQIGRPGRKKRGRR
jgi:hypothetical protein